MTKQEILKEWVRRLRSGEIKQTRNVLGRSDGSRCCLGVLCDIAVEEGVISAPTEDTAVLDNYLRYPSNPLVGPVRTWAGLAGGDPSLDDKSWIAVLADKSDTGATFAEIADIIESEPEGLFV